MLDNSALREPFDVSSLENEVSALVAERSTEPHASPIRRALPRHDRRLPEPRIEDRTEMAEPTGTEDATPAGDSIEAILAERGKTHGDFTDNARVMQALKRIVHAEVGWDKLTDVQREALHMILHKVGRIISGNPNTKDHWDDIAGYAKLASERI
jgi:hypothetical protein